MWLLMATVERRGNAMPKPFYVFVLALGLVCGMAVAAAQERSERIGLLGPPEEPRFSEVRDGLRQGLRDHGYTEKALELLEARVTRRDHVQVRTAVEDFLQQRIRVLVVIGSELAKLVREVSAELPIVYITPGDPVAQGLAASLARPGGHTTAMTFEYPELAGKRLELLQEILPQVRRVLILYDPRDDSSRQSAAAAREAALKLGLTLVERETHSQDDIARGLAALAEVEAFLVILGGLPTRHYAEIIRAANAKRVPTMFHARTGSTMEALVSYGVSDVEIARQLARYVAKILAGVKAGDLPVERPMKLELVINLTIAQHIGVTIPSAVLMQADKVLR
jgi:putative tryptophan/tyrosine transport system substrate-binding protein